MWRETRGFGAEVWCELTYIFISSLWLDMNNGGEEATVILRWEIMVADPR